MNDKDESATAKGGVGTVGIKRPQTCNYVISASLNIGQDSVYTGGMPLQSTDLVGKDNLKIVMGMAPTTMGVEM